MDFASLMKSQMAGETSSASAKGGKQYLKRSEVEAQRQADYHREQQQLEDARKDRLEKKRKHEEEEAERNRMREEKRQKLADQSKRLREEEEEVEERARRKRLGLPELERQIDGGGCSPALKEGEQDVPEEELLVKLHDLGEPRILFGETHAQRLRRFRKLTEKSLAPKLSTGPIPTTLELLPEAEMKVPETVPADSTAYKLLLRQLASYFDMLLSEWQSALARRSKEVKESTSGKQAYSWFLAARDNLRPLFKKLETDGLNPKLLGQILEIVHLAQLKRYVAANDAYLRLSIGKAAWPIGVTMVGIHERSAREKLHETGNEGHILSDEATRKMIQGIKRCLTYAQTRWPPTDLSQMMG